MNNKNSNVNLILIALLMLVSFAAGYFYFKIKMLETGGVAKTGQEPTEEAKKLLKNPKFKACLDSEKYKDKVQADADEAKKAGVASTPTSVVFDLKTGRTFVIRGAQPYESVKKDLQAFMQGKDIPLPKRDPGYPKWNLKAVQKPDPKNDHWRGSTEARFVLVEYSDFECPFCKRFHATVRRLVDENKDQLAWVYRHLPLDAIHPYARVEAEASECAAEIGGNDGFWKYADGLFEKTKSNGRSFDKDSLESLAAELSIK
ncbi:MAG: thioredoxin domain-containing protein [bacterium]|nr:thioredoxin domain-containing protein [bacterium]